jgi:hypothetical protein
MNLTDEPTDLPSPTPLPPPSARPDMIARFAAAVQPRSSKRRLQAIGAGVAVFVGIGVLGTIGGNDDDNDSPGRRYTLTEAACKMLREGDDPEFVYSVTKDLAADHPLQLGEDEALAARLAVDAAQAQGCG